MRNHSNKTFQTTALAVLAFLICFSCETDTEGCLDPQADNFDVSVDDPCSSCCTYPTLQIAFLHNADTNIFLPDSILINNVGLEFKIRDMEFFISDFEVEWENNGWTGVEDSVVIISRQPPDSIHLSDNFARVKRSRLSATLGGNRGFGQMNKVRFQGGLVGNVLDADPTGFVSPQALAITNTADSVLLDEFGQYKNFIATVITGVGFLDTTKFCISTGESLAKVEITVDSLYNLGLNKIISLEIDYTKWLDNLSPTPDSVQIRQALIDNFSSVFSVSN